MRPARIPSSPHFLIGWAVLGLLGAAALGCSSADTGPKGITEGMALGKFCHDLNRSGIPVTLTLQFGDPAITTISARTGVCAPLKGMPCQTIPVGLVQLKLMEADKELARRAVILSNGPDGGAPHEYLFQAIISNLQVGIVGGLVRAPEVCQELDFPVPDGGIRDAGGDGSVGEGGAGDGGATEAGTPDAGVPDVAVTPDVGTTPDMAAADAPEDGPAPAADTAPDSLTD
jgi:hypothetical protein